MATIVELPLDTYVGPVDPDWCPGCGDFGVLKALKMAAGQLGIHPKDLLVISGIGCSSNLPGFIHAYGVHSLHGRSIPIATGARLANTDLCVVITGGDGDGYGIGLGHFVHAMRRNLDLTYVVMNNQVYGLTTGQASPTTSKEHRTKSTPRGNVETPLNPIALALVSGATYIARAFSGEPRHMADILVGAIAHKGFSLVDVFSPCVTYNKINTYPWFKQRVYKLEGERAYNPAGLEAAFHKSLEWGERIPLGLFFQEERPTYEDSEPVLQKGALVDQKLGINPKLFDELIEETV